MTESYDPCQNAVTERINGILKQEFRIYKYKDYDINIIKSVVKESIDIYNSVRPHWSNYMLTPIKIHRQSKIEMRIYKQKTEVTKKLLLSKNCTFIIINPVSLF